nr:crossover junction endodeoxyribonuclease RuvC [Paracoccaceae bacterium]
MRVLGIDPGLRTLGWGVIEVAGSRIGHLGNGHCVSAGADLAARLLSLFEQLTEVVARYAPDAAAVEQTFVNRD